LFSVNNNLTFSVDLTSYDLHYYPRFSYTGADLLYFNLKEKGDTQMIKQASIAVGLTVLLSLGACSTTGGTSGADTDTAARLAELKRQEAALAAREAALATRESSIAQASSATSGGASANVMLAGGEMLPPNARPGECWARAWKAPTYKTVTERVLTKQAAERVEVIPAEYGTATERMLVKEESSRLVAIPATYGTETERVQTSPAETYWSYSNTGVTSARTGLTNSKASASTRNSMGARIADAGILSAARTSGVPANPSAGSCYAEYYSPAQYGTSTERLLKNQASQRVEVIPAQYETVTERVLVAEPGETTRTIPATYGTETERVLVRPARTEWQVSECSGGACLTDTVQNRVAGVADRIDQSTGEIMCLVEIPAEYKTITKRVMKTPPRVEKTPIPAKYETQQVRKLVKPASERVVAIPETYQTVSSTKRTSDPVTSWCSVGGSNTAACAGGNGANGGSNASSCSCSTGHNSGSRPTGNALCGVSTPAQYKTVTKRVVKTPASTRKEVIPAEYRTVTVRKLVKPSSERRIAIPEEYGTVTRQEQASPGAMQWMSVLCQKNMTRTKIQEIQRALQKAGHYRGPIDGVVGGQTITAIQSYQVAKGLVKTSMITMEAVKALGVNPS